MIRLRELTVLLILALPASNARACDTLDACLAELSTITAANAASFDEHDALAQKFAKLGSPAVGPLLELLDSTHQFERRIASYALQGISETAPENIDRLIAAMNAHHSVAADLLDKAATPEAADAIAKYLRQHPEKVTSVPNALNYLDDAGMAQLTDGFACTENCESAARNAFETFDELRESGSPALAHLLAIARNPEYALEARKWTLEAIKRIGSAAQHADGDLLLIADETPVLRSAVNSTLVTIGSAKALPAVLSYLDTFPIEALDQIYRLGKAGVGAGAEVTRMLDHEDWLVRNLAVRALGRMGYTPAAPDLARQLTNTEDWQLVVESILALVALDSQEFADSIDSVGDTHWYPSLRVIAKKAVEHLRAGTSMRDDTRYSQFYSSDHSPSCTHTEHTGVVKNVSVLRVPDDKETLGTLGYSVSDYGYAPFRGAQVSASGTFTTRYRRAETTTDARQETPQFATKVTDGWIAGASRGEWGGELVYIPEKGTPTILWGSNTFGIYLLDQMLIAIAKAPYELGHSSLLLKVQQQRDGTWQAQPWRRLPATITSTTPLENHRLLIHTRRAGSMIVDRSGDIQMVECTSSVFTHGPATLAAAFH